MTSIIEDDTVIEHRMSRQEMRKIWNKNYAQSENGKEVKRLARIRFLVKYPEKKENFYETYHDTVLKCQKDYYERNRELICAKAREKYHAKQLAKKLAVVAASV